MRVLLYCQSFQGSGHFVRSREIARALTQRHQVVLIDGGRPIERPAVPGLSLLPLPRLCRRQGRLCPLDSDDTLTAVLEQRRQTLADAAQQLRPDVLVIEHYPFSKWEMEAEILALIDACRPSAKVVCSLRDVPPAFVDNAAATHYQDYVTRILRDHFALLLVHADPNLIRLEEFFSWAAKLPIPLVYTGYVSEKVNVVAERNGSVVASSGGRDAGPFLQRCVEAWHRLTMSSRRLVVFLPPDGPRLDVDHPSVVVERFSTTFLTQLASAELSISQAGYNTCANLLETRTRAILVPSASMFDQPWRARRLAERGLVSVLAETCSVEELAAAIQEALQRPQPSHDVDLNGAARTRELLEGL